MKRFGRVIGDFVIDVFDAESVEVLEKRLGVKGFIEVLADTLSGDRAIPDKDGYAFEHPLVVEVPPQIPEPTVTDRLDAMCSLLSKIALKLGIEE